MAIGEYDHTSVASIIEHSRGLIGQSLSEAVELPLEVSNSKAKGRLGELVEEFWFEIKPDNVNHLPDFPEAGLELKTTGVRHAKKQKYLAKERLVLTLIHPPTLGAEDSWSTSTFLKKCRLILILFYLYEKDVPEIERRFVDEPRLLDILNLQPQYLTQIVKDWEFIRDKCAGRRAHELSEGDTTYLKACRKGSGGKDEALVSQGDGAPGAQRRAFSLPASFVSRLIGMAPDNNPALVDSQNLSVEESAQIKLTPWIGLEVSQIAHQVDFESRAKSKNFYLVNKLLTGTTKKPREFTDAGLFLRTLTIDEHGTPTEDLPFDAFDPIELEAEDWEESQLAQDLERRYLLAIFQKTATGQVVFRKAGFWTMPFTDRKIAKEVWFNTVQLFLQGNYEQLPKLSDDFPIFVRTHGANRRDKVRTSRGDLITKRSFWISKYYMKRVIESHLSW